MTAGVTLQNSQLFLRICIHPKFHGPSNNRSFAQLYLIPSASDWRLETWIETEPTKSLNSKNVFHLLSVMRWLVMRVKLPGELSRNKKYGRIPGEITWTGSWCYLFFPLLHLKSSLKSLEKDTPNYSTDHITDLQEGTAKIMYVAH